MCMAVCAVSRFPDRPATAANREGNSFFYPYQGDKKERQVVVDPFGLHGRISACRANPGPLVQDDTPWLHAADQEKHGQFR